MFCEETYREFAEAVKNGKVGIAELESRLTRSDDPAQISKTLEGVLEDYTRWEIMSSGMGGDTEYGSFIHIQLAYVYRERLDVKKKSTFAEALQLLIEEHVCQWNGQDEEFKDVMNLIGGIEAEAACPALDKAVRKGEYWKVDETNHAGLLGALDSYKTRQSERDLPFWTDQAKNIGNHYPEIIFSGL